MKALLLLLLTSTAWADIKPVQSHGLYAGVVDTAKLATDSVTTAKILNGAVDTSKLATDSVTAAKILNGAVTALKLAASNAFTMAGLTINANDAALSVAAVTGTSRVYQSIANGTAVLNIGVSSSSGDAIILGELPYSASISAAGARSLHLGTNNNVRLTVSPEGQVSTVTPMTVISSMTVVGATSTDTGKMKIGGATAPGCFIMGKSNASGCVEVCAVGTALTVGDDADCEADGTP